MPKIDIVPITKALPKAAANLPVNVVLVQPIPSAEDAKAPPRALRVRSMKDVAEIARPGFKVALSDQHSAKLWCTVDYSEGVNTPDDLAAHLNPDWVHEHIHDEHGGPMNVQQRLRSRQEIVARLHTYLRKHPERLAQVGQLLEELKKDRAELMKRLTELQGIDATRRK